MKKLKVSAGKQRTSKYGWVPDVPDHRDLLYGAIRPKLKLPASVDLRAGCSLVEDQGQLGSCTANALAGNLEFLDKQIDGAYTDVSRLFIYYNERAIEGHITSDSGAMIRNGVKSLSKAGVCAEQAWPYNIAAFANKPPVACYNEAKKHCIVSYHRILTLNEMLGCLAEGFPFVFGFSVYESFEGAAVAKTGVVTMPKKTEKLIGGHAVLAVGYNQKDKTFLVRNSWGPKWGKGGYFTMPFEYLQTMADDFWTIRK